MEKYNKIDIICPFYNPGRFLDNCVASLVTQKYDNYRMVFVDDTSTDNSWNKLPHNNSKAICIKNNIRKTALENIHNAIIDHCEPETIVILCDGDDWFASKHVLSFINDFYNKNDCYITWGQAMWTNGRRGCARPVTNETEFKKIRTDYSAFFVSHLRTFKAGLYHRIKEQDSEFFCLKDNQGKFYKMTYDVAMFLPMLEMAGFNRSKYIDKVLYIYNRDNPISDDKVNQALQTNIHLEILKKPAFKKIEKL